GGKGRLGYGIRAQPTKRSSRVHSVARRPRSLLLRGYSRQPRRRKPPANPGQLLVCANLRAVLLHLASRSSKRSTDRPFQSLHGSGRPVHLHTVGDRTPTQPKLISVELHGSHLSPFDQAVQGRLESSLLRRLVSHLLAVGLLPRRHTRDVD